MATGEVEVMHFLLYIQCILNLPYIFLSNKNPIFLYNFKFLSFLCDLGQFFHYHTTYSHYISSLH
jgi:hypothetical protein